MIFTCKSIPEGYEAGIRELLAPRGHEICREGCAAGSIGYLIARYVWGRRKGIHENA